ncbi:hypothetical protein, partial [Chondromyces apiculatus]|uniref:hypothetical protein n=1 Tax=Chondromyces apiculatus TaxID=51 RepID=UPI0007C5D4FF
MRARPLASPGAVLLLLPLCGLIAGCPDDPKPPPDPEGPSCLFEPVGDVNAPIELEIIALDPDYQAYPVEEGSVVHNIFPPQGGRVVFAGVRARNIDPCAVLLAGALRDPVSKQVRPESRTVNLRPGEDGWASSVPTDISTFSNIPTCPNQWASQDLYGVPYELIVEVTERSGRKASASFTVQPVCEEAGFIEECRCICQGGYELGEVCTEGTGGGGGAGG